MLIKLQNDQCSGHIANVGDHLESLKNEHCGVISNLSNLLQSLDTELLIPMKDKTELVKPIIQEMDKNHVKSFKKMFSSYNNRKKELTRLENKMKKTRKSLPDLQYKKEQKIREIDLECKNLEDEERRQIADISNLEWELYKSLGSGICEIVKQELNIFGLNFDITRELLKFTDVMESSFEVSDAEVLQEHVEYDGLVRVTPPTSPSMRGGGLMRRMSGSMMSLSSIMDESLNKVRKKSQPSQPLILTELSEMMLEESPPASIKSNNIFDTKVRKRSQPIQPIIFTELSEMMLEESPPTSKSNMIFDNNGIPSNFDIDTINECHVKEERGFYGLERENSFVSGDKTDQSVSFQSSIIPTRRTRYNSFSENPVKTNFEDHIRFLEDQNDLIFHLVDEQMRVDQVLNGDPGPSS